MNKLIHSYNEAAAPGVLAVNTLRAVTKKSKIGAPVVLKSRAGAMLAASALANPIMPDWTDVQPWMFYDRLTVATNAATGTDFLFFTTPLSATKSKLDTNLKQAGRLPDPKHFFVTALRFVFSSRNKLTDIARLVDNFYVEFEIGDKIYAEGHVDLYPGGAGVYGVSTKTDESSYTNGVADPNSVNLWGSDRGIHILQGQNFQVRLRGTTFTTSNDADSTGLNIRCVLDGILYREVQ